jgi:hypothetical protein
MNFEDTLKKMIEAAAGAAKIHWNDFRTYAEQEFKRLAEAGAWLEADYIADVAAAERQQKAANREKLKRKAKLRAELAFDSLRLASEGVVTAAKADAKIAAQDAINAALAVLRTAVNESVGIALL